MFLRILRVLEVFVYYSVFLYLQFKMTQYNYSNQSEYNKNHVAFIYFMLLEIITYYTQVFSMVIYLSYIMIRGMLGLKNYAANKCRYKFDALEYYKIDVTWLSF